MEKAENHFLEGFTYYLKAIFFVRPKKKIIQRFIKRVVMHQRYEFNPSETFIIFNRNIGALLIHGSRYYIYAWKYEEKPSRLFKCLLKALGYGVFVDIGAYVGYYSVFSAKHGWKVIAFEPNPLNRILLRYNALLYDVKDKVTIIDKAVSAEQGHATFTISSSPSESSFTNYLRSELRLANVDVEVTTIDSIIESMNISNENNLILKIDVEGFGLNVIRGAMKTIDRFRPFILFEIHRTFDKQDEIYALSLLRKLGYNFITIEPRSTRNFIVYAYPKEKGCLCCEQA